MKNKIDNFISAKKEYEKSKKEFKKQQHQFWEGILKEVKNSEFNIYFREKIGREKEVCHGVGQYEEISWIRLYLSDDIKNKLNGTKYHDVTAIHIMPYCITAEDVIKAKQKKDGFNNRNIGFVDYDPSTGNFHKKIAYQRYGIEDIYPQIVLVYKTSQFGPQWKKETAGQNLFVKDNGIVKTNWYFPRIIEKEQPSEIKTEKEFKEKINNLLTEVTTEIQKAINKNTTAGE